MANYPAKHEFVDDYPYLAYASEVDTAVENGEGGGGGGGEYVLPVASENTLGGVKIGSGLDIDSNGVLSSGGGGEYELPIASENTLGGVKIGNGLRVDSTGILQITNLMLQVTYDETINTGVLDHTFNEIENAFTAGGKVFLFDDKVMNPDVSSYFALFAIVKNDSGGGSVAFASDLVFMTDSDSGYPVLNNAPAPGN